MRLLVDTHLAIWTLTGDARLSASARRLLVDSDNTVFVSAASIWEIAIKHQLARSGGDMPFSGQEAVELFGQAGLVLLSVSAAHAAAVERLPLIHADPFDRLLLAQALTEPMTLMTHDERVAAYDASIIKV